MRHLEKKNELLFNNEQQMRFIVDPSDEKSTHIAVEKFLPSFWRVGKLHNDYLSKQV